MAHTIRRSVLVVAALAGIPAGVALADDIPAVVPPRGMHASIVCSDGSVRDDELAAAIAFCILLNGRGVHDIKVMFNSCYGGGILDDIQALCGAGGPLAGTPWVGGAASAWDECAQGWTDAVVNAPANAGKDLGSTWTDALGGKATSPTDNSAGAMRAGSNGNVQRDLERARGKDDSGPNGDGSEHPQVASGNGGDGITWTGAHSHHAVVFGGDQTDQRHHNNVNNMEDALNAAWAGTPHSVTKIDGGTRQDLFDAICAAASQLDENEQFVLYIDDHGDFEVDVDEFLEWALPHFALSPVFTAFDVPPGYADGLHRVVAQGDDPHPAVWIDLASPLVNAGEWSAVFNGVQTPLPRGTLTGRIAIPVLPSLIHAGPNQLGLVCQGPPRTIGLQGLTLWSGALNDLDRDDPGCGADFNGDGFLDFFDYDAYVICFETADCPPGRDADFNGDGFADFFDYDAFVLAFETGC